MGKGRPGSPEGSSSNPANIENLTKELNTLHRAHAKDQEKLAEMERDITKNTELRNEAWTSSSTGSVAEPSKKSGPRAPIDVLTDLE